MKKERAILLYNIRSAHNVGSIFRTADAAGVSKVYLSGVTPAPIDRFGRVQKEIKKTALGGESYTPWERVSTTSIIRLLRKERWQIVGVEQDERARDYRKFVQNRSALFIFGSEVLGLSKSICNLCDVLLEIPMHGKKESLNVSVAAGIILFGVS